MLVMFLFEQMGILTLDTPDRVNDKQNTLKSALVRVGFTRRFLNVNQPKSIILGVRRKVR